MKYLLLCLLLLGLPVVARADATNTVPPIDVTLFVSKGVDYFRAQAATNEDGWFFHPIEGSKIVGWKTNMVHFKSIEVNIPGYRGEDPYEVMVPGNTPLDPMQRQTRYRTIVPDPKQDHKEMREVPDPNGPIERNWPLAIYEKDEGCRWRYGGLGNNALAIFALRRCGIRSDDPLITQPLMNLAKIINEFGYPDTTYDLAWMTVAFAVTPGDGYKKLTQECAAKLMDAQITSGPATGLWGPVAVNPAMVSAMLKTMIRLGDEKKNLQKEITEEQAKKLKGKPTARGARLEEEAAKIDARLQELQDPVDSTRITQFGLIMFDIFGNQQYGGDLWGRRTLTFQGDRLNVDTLPYLIQNQIGADLDSTALALFALRTAIENGRLPGKTWRPEEPKFVPSPGNPTPPPSDFPPAREAREIVLLAAKALNAAKPANGQWPEINIQQRVTDFAWLKSIPQVVSNEFPKLPQPVTFASEARGAAALGNIQIMQTGKFAPTPLESEAFKPMLEDLINERLVLTNTDVRQPYDALIQMIALHKKDGNCARTDYTGWNQMAEWVVRRQTPSGAWGRKDATSWVMMTSTSLRALVKTLGVVTDAALTKMYDKPHITPAMTYPGNIVRYGAPEASYFTVASLLFLAEGLPNGWIPPVPAPVPPPDAAAPPPADAK